MEALTDGALREQMQRQMQHRKAAEGAAVYRSFARVIEKGENRAVVEEKFHLFWSRGLRFVMHYMAEGWQRGRGGLLAVKG